MTLNVDNIPEITTIQLQSVDIFIKLSCLIPIALFPGTWVHTQASTVRCHYSGEGMCLWFATIFGKSERHQYRLSIFDLHQRQISLPSQTLMEERGLALFLYIVILCYIVSGPQTLPTFPREGKGRRERHRLQLFKNCFRDQSHTYY